MRNLAGVLALLGWAGLFYWGWVPPILAGAVMVLVWIDGYLNGKGESQ